MIVAVGSSNPVKLNAAKMAFTKIFGNVNVISTEVNSGVSHMPMSANETIRGAENRAKLSLEKNVSADFGVGMEGGVEDTEAGLMLCGYTVVVNRKGKIGVGGGTSIVLPKIIAMRVMDGEELGNVTDSIFEEDDTKKKYGAIGLLTNNIIGRTELFESFCIYALAPFISPEVYDR
jgi:inosine/xanthosine triphosphatase